MTIRAVRITEYLNKYEAREYVRKMRGKAIRRRKKACIAESE